MSMILEQDAKNLWCPFGSKYTSGGGGCNRDVHNEPATKCLGKGCAAWRWGALWEYDGPGAVKGSEVAAPAGHENRTYKPRKGYCGLAGRPRY